MNPLQKHAYKLFFSMSMKEDFERALLMDEILESYLNIDCKALLTGYTLKRVGELLGYLQYARYAFN